MLLHLFDGCGFDGCDLGVVSYDLGVDRGCGKCPGTGFQKIGAYDMWFVFVPVYCTINCAVNLHLASSVVPL